jgi:putative effector of murein hydrolase LrgA (UPF0299 family)
MHRDIVTTEKAIALPERFGPFQPWFFFGVAAVEIVMMTAFAFAIIKSIIHRKDIENHAWWLITTVFLIMMPALGRGIQSVYIGIYIKEWPDINIMSPIYYTQILIIGMLLLGAWKYEKLKHSATWLAVGVNLFIFLLEPIGRSEAMQTFLKALIKGYVKLFVIPVELEPNSTTRDHLQIKINTYHLLHSYCISICLKLEYSRF